MTPTVEVSRPLRVVHKKINVASRNGRNKQNTTNSDPHSHMQDGMLMPMWRLVLHCVDADVVDFVIVVLCVKERFFFL